MVCLDEVIEVKIEAGGYGMIAQLVLYLLAGVFIIYLAFKALGLFKDAGKKVEELIKAAQDELSKIPHDFSEEGHDIWTMVRHPGSPAANAAKVRVHYGGPEWAPGNVATGKNGTLKKYGQEIKPGESQTFVGSTYIERVVNNQVKDPTGSGYVTKEDAIAHKYGFRTYAQFNAWLQGVKAALRATGKDPNQMTLDEIVKWGQLHELTQSSGGRFESYKPPEQPVGAVQIDLPTADKLLSVVYPHTKSGGIEIGATPIELKKYVEPVYHILPVRPGDRFRRAV